jgi:hypothetical protein
MKNRFLFIVTALFMFSCTDADKTKDVTVHNEQFNWTIAIPDGFERETVEEMKELQERGAQAIEETFDTEIENLAKSIFVFKKDETNYFDSNHQPFDTAIDGDYLTSCNGVNQVIYETFMAQMPDVPMDSNSTTQMIDGLEFQQFNIVIDFPGDVKLTTHMYSRLFGTEELTINIMYVEPKSGEEMMASWLNSSFH